MTEGTIGRRSFMKRLGMVGAAASLPVGTLLTNPSRARAAGYGPPLNSGDAAILRFLAAAELIESDLWTQYAELGGIGDNQPIEINPNPALNNYQLALSNLDPDGPQYITSNTLDEISHADFLNAFLESRGAEAVNFDEFRTLDGSTATGSSGIKRLTNLMHLNVDTSWFVRYRSATNPDLGATFPQAISLQDVTAIPRTDADFGDIDPNFNVPGNAQIQAIANVAAFHFGMIEQGGSSLYAAMSQKVTGPEVLQITLGIGGDEIAHFLEWVDFSGNGVQAPVAPFTDSVSGVTFPDFFSPLNPLIQPSLIFPVPCEFISPSLPHVSIIRPLTDKFAGAVAAVAGFTDDGLFVGQSTKFLEKLQSLAKAADAATREL
ncbi:MAG TPA: twin-arginine translocation signal domain-containing protein [Candidatus Baltobacteraceae bacterium]|nr:twin-arginine translocation signal domain-containing protein [Candidatus Baltobacteraceae bacterium]